MEQREVEGSRWAAGLYVMCLAAGIAVAVLWLWPGAEPGLGASSMAVPKTTPVIEAAATEPVVAEARQPVTRIDATPVAVTKPPLVFEKCVAQLCTMGARVAELAQDDEHDAARKLDGEVRQLVADVLEAFADAGERSLGMLVGMAGDPEPASDEPLRNTRLGVLQVLLQRDLGRRHRLAEQVKDHSRSNALVQAVLDSMPVGKLATQMGDRCLHKAPYLRGEHEPTVLHLLKLANDNEFSREVATHMLMTLWDNLVASGERTSAELSRLALLQLDGSDPSEIVAACRQLLSDANYRAMVLAWLRDRSDRTLAGSIAELAARELPVRDALEVLRELSPMLGHRRGTYMALGIRSPQIVADAYREHLAANNQPDIRRELIMGVSMLPDQKGLELAELALQNDPSPQVRIQAMFAFTIHADAAKAEQVVSQLLDEPAIANSQLHLNSVVLALENLKHGDPNTIARLGARLQSMSLSEQSRKSLAALMARCLPNGGTPRPGSGG